jgi:Co/Zn/Cd efflux system component
MNASAFSSWQFWAVLSAVFAALTAIFAKVGVENVNSDLATFIRTIVVICILGLIVYATRQFQNPSEISGRTYLFLLLSGLGTGRVMAVLFPRAETRQRGASGADRQIERRAGRHLRRAVSRRKTVRGELARRRAGRRRRDPGGAALSGATTPAPS